MTGLLTRVITCAAYAVAYPWAAARLARQIWDGTWEPDDVPGR